MEDPLHTEDHALPFGAREATGPRSLTRLLALFDVLALAPDGMSLAELSTVLGSPKSSLLNLLRPLVTEAYLIHEGVTYRLGPSMFRLASGVHAAWALPRVVRPTMERLAQRTTESVLLSVIDPARGCMTYIEIVQSPHPVRYQLHVGTVRPLYASTSGRVMLAFAEEAWLQRYLAQVVIVQDMAQPVTLESLRRDLIEIRRDHLASSLDAYMMGLSSVTAPLLVNGECVACLTIAGPTDRVRGNIRALKTAVTKAALKAGAALTRFQA